MAKLKDGFYKLTASSIGSDLLVLLAGGGAKPISDFALAFNVKIWGLDFDGSSDVTGDLFLGANKILGKDAADIVNAGSNHLVLGYGSSEKGWPTYVDGNPTYFRYGTSHSVGMFLDSSGKVGIGNIAPQQKLDVSGKIKADALYLTRSNGDVAFTIAEESGTNGYNITASGGSSFIRFYTNSGGASAVERMRIHTNGYVGIGTSSPTLPLSVNGQERIIASTNASSITLDTCALIIGPNTAGHSGYSTGIGFNSLSYGNYINHIHAWIGLGPYTTTATAECYPLVFATNGSTTTNTAPVERMRITPDGNVGIGDSNPAYKLEVAGSICGTVIYANRDGSTTAGGVSLYSNSDPMTYGIAFRGTGTYGTHGYVTAADDWATYLTMSDTAARGWIFRRGSTNVASIAGSGNMAINENLEFSNGAHIATNRTSDYHYSTLSFSIGNNSKNIGMYSGPEGEAGGVVVSPDGCLIYNSSDSGYNLQVRDKDLGTDLTNVATLTFGIEQSGYYAWSRGGFKKNGSDDTYVLLGGGGHKLESNLSVNYAASTGNADTVDSCHKDDFLRRTETLGYLSKFVLEDIPKGVTQVGSIGWTDYQNHPHAGGLWMTLRGISSLSTALILFPSYSMSSPPILYSSIDGGAWQGGYQLAYTSQIPTTMAWGSITGKPSSFTPSSHTHTYIESKANYTFTSSTLPNSFDWGVSAGFVADSAGYGSYGSVLTVRTYTGGGGTLQLYAPYSKTYGGERLKARFGNYDSNVGNSWTTLKEIAWTSDIPNPTNYYWANVKVSSSSSTTTYPTFGSLYVYNDSCNNSNDALAYFRHRSTNDWCIIVDKGGYDWGVDVRSFGPNAMKVAGRLTLGQKVSERKYTWLKLTTPGHTGSDGWCIGVDDTTDNSYLYMKYNENDSTYFYVRHDGCSFANHFYENSDIKLKENINLISSSDNIPLLKEFNWKSDGKHSYGLIAQELEAMGYSELVEESGDHKTVNYSAALSLIVGKLQVKIKELEKEIEILKNKN